MVLACCVPNCKTRQGKDNAKFHLFPKDGNLKKIWLNNIKIGRDVGKTARVCSKHFLAEDYNVTSLGQWMMLKRKSVPTRCLPKHLPQESHVKIKKPKGVAMPVTVEEEADGGTAVQERSSNKMEDDQDLLCFIDDMVVPEVIVIDEITDPGSKITKKEGISLASMQTQTMLSSEQSQYFHFPLLSDQELIYLCGFNASRFNLIYKFIMRMKPEVPISSCRAEDQLLLTLCRYRLNLENRFLALLFKINVSIVSQIFSTWTQLIYDALKSANFWSLGYQNSSTCRVVMDCTKTLIQGIETSTYSRMALLNDDSNHTVKSVIGVDERELVVFCSELYQGSISNKEMTKKSGFIDLLKEGDSVTADTSFDIWDLLENKNVKLTMVPQFSQGVEQLKRKGVMETDMNSKVHVTRVLSLVKKYKMLTDGIPSNLWPLANQINFNCFMLLNFRKNIVIEYVFNI